MFLLLIGLSMLGTGLFVGLLLQATYLDSLTGRLNKEGTLLAQTLHWGKRDSFDAQANTFGRALSARVIILDRDGNVLGDSAKAKADTRNLRYLPEVQQALKGKPPSEQMARRRDNRLNTAIPVIRNGQLLGAVWIQLDVTDVNRSIRQIWISMAGGLAVAYLLAALASSRFARDVTRPIEEITRVAEDIAHNQLYRSVAVYGEDEIGRLGEAINRMARSLRSQMSAIRKSERRLTSVIETMESVLFLVDPSGSVSLANPAFERLFGVPVSDIQGKSVHHLPGPYELIEMIARCQETGERQRKELHIFYPEERIVEASLSPMGVEKDGRGVVAVLHDITAIRRLEKMRSEFVANVSHELKTPITSIVGFTETLLDGAMQDPDTCREFLEIILEEGNRLQRLVGDILDLSKIESKQIHLDLESVPVGELIQSATKTMEDQFRAKQLTLEVRLPDPSFTVTVDRDRFRQILLNLLSNAMAYTPPGGMVTVQAERDEESWRLQVADTGIGIPKEDLPRIFERFYRVDKARSRASGGTGLGLAIVKHLVEVHKGTIHVESQVGEGTTFTLTFPLQDAAEAGK
jgi:two-component system phosphate regulon sensor histidine kinase PhoR